MLETKSQPLAVTYAQYQCGLGEQSKASNKMMLQHNLGNRSIGLKIIPEPGT